MIEQRYYIVTLVAVFLSMTVGIFIGNALLGDDLVLAQQQEVIECLRDNYKKLQEEQRCLQEQLVILQVWEETNQELEKILIPLVEDKRDSRVRLAIVNTSGSETDPHLSDFLEHCNINVQIMSLVSASFTPDNECVRSVFRDERYRSAGSEWLELVRYLAGAITGTRSGELLNTLIDEGLVTVSGNPLPGIDVALLLGGSETEGLNRFSELDEHLITAWLEEGIRVIAAERTETRTLIEQYKKAGVSTVGHINTLAGRLSLLYLITNEQQGHFGYGNDTDPLLPLDWLREKVKKE